MDNSTIQIERAKREATNIISRCSTALRTVNLNRQDANIMLFRELVSEIATAANELIIIAHTIDVTVTNERGE